MSGRLSFPAAVRFQLFQYRLAGIAVDQDPPSNRFSHLPFPVLNKPETPGLTNHRRSDIHSVFLTICFCFATSAPALNDPPFVPWRKQGPIRHAPVPCPIERIGQDAFPFKQPTSVVFMGFPLLFRQEPQMNLTPPGLKQIPARPPSPRPREAPVAGGRPINVAGPKATDESWPRMSRPLWSRKFSAARNGSANILGLFEAPAAAENQFRNAIPGVA